MKYRGTLYLFDSPEQLTKSAAALRAAGYREFDAITPYALEKVYALVPPERETRWASGRLAEKHSWIFGARLNLLGILALFAGLGGAATGFGMQWIANSWAYPLNAGGRPHFSWPNFIPITFVLGILFAAGAVFLGFFLFLRLPEPHHPLFDASAYRLDHDKFYLFVSRDDPKHAGAEKLLHGVVGKEEVA